MLDRIETLMKDLRQVTTDIAHDLRTPLTRLRQRLELASRPEIDAEAVRETLAAHRVRKSIQFSAIFAALLHIAQMRGRGAARRIQGGRSERAAGHHRRTLSAHGGGQRPTLCWKRSHGIAGDQGEHEMLMQLFANLIENALRHTPRGSTIEMRASRRACDEW